MQHQRVAKASPDALRQYFRARHEEENVAGRQLRARRAEIHFVPSRGHPFPPRPQAREDRMPAVGAQDGEFHVASNRRAQTRSVPAPSTRAAAAADIARSRSGWLTSDARACESSPA